MEGSPRSSPPGAAQQNRETSARTQAVLTSSAMNHPSLPPRMARVLPIALLVHQAEEWFGGFPEWTSVAFGDGVEPEQFLLINAIGLLLITFWTVAAFWDPRISWIVVSFAALLGLNAVLHALATLLLGLYSPGTVTGLLVSLPLSVIVLRSSADGMPNSQFLGAILPGVLLHGAVTFIALA